MIAVICAFVLIAALAWHSGYLHSQVRRLHRRCDGLFTIIDGDKKHLDKLEKRIDKSSIYVQAVEARIDRVEARIGTPANRPMTLAERLGAGEDTVNAVYTAAMAHNDWLFSKTNPYSAARPLTLAERRQIDALRSPQLCECGNNSTGDGHCRFCAARRRQWEEPCSGICPKCGEERVEWPAGVGFGECHGCVEKKLVNDLLYGGWIAGHSDICMCCDCFKARKEFRLFIGYSE